MASSPTTSRNLFSSADSDLSATPQPSASPLASSSTPSPSSLSLPSSSSGANNNKNDNDGADDGNEPWFATYPARQVISVAGGLAAGTLLGLNHGVTTAGLRFRAENAHRLPTTTKGWYLYHKSKNYYAMWGGLKEAGRMAVKLGFWAGAFVAVEESVHRLRRDARDRVREQRALERARRLGLAGRGVVETTTTTDTNTADALDTVVAGLAIAGGWSAWNRFPLITAARTARMGLAFGVVYGLTQDAWRLVRGRKVTYVEFVKRRFGGREQQQRPVETAKS